MCVSIAVQVARSQLVKFSGARMSLPCSPHGSFYRGRVKIGLTEYLLPSGNNFCDMTSEGHFIPER